MDSTNLASNYNVSSLNSRDNTRTDLSALGYGQQYMPTLKTAGYLIGEPVSYSSTSNLNTSNVRPVTPKLSTNQEVINTKSGTQILQAKSVSSNVVLNSNMNSNSRISSRIVYDQRGQMIVNQHPSRPTRSPSPISQNPQANIVPHTNFIYNSTNSPPPARYVSYSPPKTTTVIPTNIVQRQVITSIKAPPIPISNVNVNVNAQMVPRAQYDKCVSQCKIWEQKYNQLYSIMLQNKNSSNSYSKTTNINTNINSQQYQYIVKQNRRLKERVRQLQINQQKLVTNVDDIITSLVNKYRDSTLKQCMLLADRYRLEKKMYDKM